MTDKRRVIGLTLTELVGLGTVAFLLYYVSITGASRMADAWAVDRVVAYALLFVAPLLVFIPFNMALRLGPVWVLGTTSWALLGYVLFFASAPERSTADVFTYIAFLTLMFIALGSAFAVPLGAVSNRIFPPAQPGWLRALRQGALLSLFVVTLLAMSPLGVLNWLNVFLVFTIVALTEFFFLARA